MYFMNINKPRARDSVLHFNKSTYSKSQPVKFSLIESVICLFTKSSVETIFFTVKSVNFH